MTQGDFVCDRCGHCCKTLRVPLTLHDLQAMLAARGRQSVEDCVELLGSDEVDMTDEPESMALLREGRHLLVLKHRGEESDAAGCVFLSDSEGCTIHAFRPTSCRAYPYDRPSEAGDHSIGLHPTLLCPAETGVHSLLGPGQNSSISTRNFTEAVRRRDSELKEHAEWITRWNRKQRTRVLVGRVPQNGLQFVQALLDDAEQEAS